MRKRKTKREEFLETMDAITPWDEIVAMIEPYYYKNHLGRRARGIEVMFRMYLLATWFLLPVIHWRFMTLLMKTNVG